jgi:hypothetical protein
LSVFGIVCISSIKEASFLSVAHDYARSRSLEYFSLYAASWREAYMEQG